MLEEADLRPHQRRDWLTPAPADPAVFAAQVQTGCDAYAQAPTFQAQGGHLVSCDELTGSQALERAAPILPLRPGRVERREFEDIRHGTQCLIATFDVATGRVVSPSIGSTRTDADFAAHIDQTVATDPDAAWVFVVDNLDTHQSESLVRLVLARCDLALDPQTLGVKEQSGMLRSMATRAASLTDPAHKIRFIYTPKHCSWLNQVEIWFSLLVRKLLRRASFTSTDDLRDRILACITYFNRTTAKPFAWTYSGRPLAA